MMAKKMMCCRKLSLIAILHSLFTCYADDDCSLRIRETNLKTGGWGVFAARNYQAGDVIVADVRITIACWERRSGFLSSLVPLLTSSLLGRDSL